MKKSKATNLLKIKDLRIIFQQGKGHRTVAVDGISFDIVRGQTLGVVGESGSGKSVTALSILQLLPKNTSVLKEGDILFYDTGQKEVALQNLPEAKLNHYRGNKIAIIFQEPRNALNPVMKVGSQIAEAILLHTDSDQKIARAKTFKWLEQVKLPATDRIYNSYPHQLSGGQLQRIMIAMAMSCQPDLLIADEPTTGLDVTVQKEILQLMQDLQKETNCAILFISHDLGVIKKIATKVLVMQKGCIVEEGLTKDIFTQPKHPYTQGLIACRPPMDKRLKRLPIIEDFLSKKEEEVQARVYGLHPINKVKQETPLLSVEALQVHYVSKRNFWGKSTQITKAVDDVNFKIYPGETIGLVGESGCGKTTLGKAILQLIPNHNGQVYYEGDPVFSKSNVALKSWRKKVQIIFQDPYSSLNPTISVGGSILEVLKVHKINGDKGHQDQAIQLLIDVGLEAKHYHRYPAQLSGGQRQRVCIARALAVQPDFIVCDEPVSALDVSVQAQVLNLLKDLQDKYQFTYLFISHDFSVIRFMCDRLLVMNKGKIIEAGYTDDILNNPQEAFTKRLLEAVI